MELAGTLRLSSLILFALLHLSCARDTSRTIFLTPEEKDVITGWAKNKGLQLNTGDLTFELGSIDDAFENTMFDYLFVWGPTTTPSKVMNAWRVRQTQVSDNVLSTEPLTTPTPTDATAPEGFTTTPTPDMTTTARITKRQAMGPMMPPPAMPAMMMSGQPAPSMSTPGMMMSMTIPPPPPKPTMMMMPPAMMQSPRNTRQQPMPTTMQPTKMPTANTMQPTNTMQPPMPPTMMGMPMAPDMKPMRRFARQTHGHHGSGSHHGGHL